MLSHTREPVFVIFLHSSTSETISRGKKSTFFLPLGPSPWAEKKLISPLGDGFGGRTVQKKIPKTGSLGTKYLFLPAHMGENSYFDTRVKTPVFGTPYLPGDSLLSVKSLLFFPEGFARGGKSGQFSHEGGNRG